MYSISVDIHTSPALIVEPYNILIPKKAVIYKIKVYVYN
ncbi:hypothetical protein B0H39_001590 [Clostridium beijerinckii]|jgi:hypothetical protein|nr:hypothetical protein [Clostridium beijerinckii]